MDILVVNGSPKGKYSITLQTVLYLQKLFPSHNFEILHVGQRIKALEKDFTEAEAALKNAQMVLFSYPVYTFLAPSQLHKFIELTKQNNIDLSGKFATQITTSKHFYDITAHKYIEDNAADLKMKVIHGLSADMDDLLTEKGQSQARAFFEYIMWCAENDYYEPLPKSAAKFIPMAPTALPPSSAEKTGDVVIITDCSPEDTELSGMISRFSDVLPLKTRVVNILDYPFDGGCLGCFNCATDGTCIYKDGFDKFLRDNIQRADAIVFAFKIKDHSMGARFKMYDDRQFCNGHRTVTMGMPMGYLVSGNYSAEPNLQTVINARAEVGGNFLAGVATDEAGTDAAIDRLAATLCYALKNKYVQPQNFYGVGGMKIFRDLIYLMQGMMKADHKFYKAHNQYDFPQKHKGTVLKMYAVGALLSSPKVKAKMGNKMNEGMIAPYKKVLDNAAPISEKSGEKQAEKA